MNGDDLLTDLIDPDDPTGGADSNHDPVRGLEASPADVVATTGPPGVAPQVFEDLVDRHRQLMAASSAVLEQLLDARDRLADAEGALAIAEAEQAVLGDPSGTTEFQPEVVAARENVARRERAVARAARTVERLERELDESDSAEAAAGEVVASVMPVEQEPAATPKNLFEGVYDFVPAFLAKVYARPIGAQINSFRWCSHWWEHAEAVSRLEALWKSFETLRLDPGTGAAVWWRDFADPTMSALCGPDGPFKQCSNTQHQLIDDLPTAPAPPAFLAPPAPADGAVQS